MSDDPTVTVLQHTKKPRYEIIVGGEVIGFTQYEEVGHGVHRYVHTEVDPEHGGHGYAGILVGAALDAEREAGHRVEATCPYVKKFIEEHPEYQDLLVS